MAEQLRVGFLLYPYLTQLDLTGPAQVFAAAGGFEFHYLWKNKAPVMSDAGIALLPTTTLDECPPLDIVLIPGGPGQAALMQDITVLEWLARQGHSAKWLTSVCSGSLLLGAAGLLKGYRAVSHWNYREHLPLFGASIDPARVVQDRNRITGGGVTAGMDVALHIIAHLRGDQVAQEVQLVLEYAPEPPFDCGRPENASAAVVAGAKQRLIDQLAAVEGKLALERPKAEDFAARFAAAYSSGSAENALALYASDAVLIDQNTNLHQGHDAIKKVISPGIQAGARMRSVARACVEQGDVAVLQNDFEVTLGERVMLKSSSFEVLQFDGQAWKLAFDFPYAGLPEEG
jgi:cyclohexyl-isocyanide hydratase